MALAPRSSLRSLMLLMSHGKPRPSSFFSSSAVVLPAAQGAADTPPAVQPPAPPGRSCPKLPVEEFVHHPIPEGPRSLPRGAIKDVAGKACLNAPEDPSRAYPAPDHGSRRTCEPMAVTDSSSDEVFSSCSSAVPPPDAGTCTPAAPDVQPPALPDRSSHKLPDHEDSVVHPLPDPRRNSLSPVIEEPAQCTLEHPKYPTPDHGSASPSERVSEDLLEDPRHPLRDPPRRP